MTVLYNCRHAGDQYRITKFVDGNPESSYLCTTSECECPAGVRPTCRHRQMLPLMINLALPNQPWFLNWDEGKQMVDFNGNPLPDVPAGPHSEPTSEENCPGHVASKDDSKVCGRCGVHIDSLRPPIDDLFNLPQYHGVVIKEVDAIPPLPEGVQLFTLDGDPLALYNAIADAVGEPALPIKPWRRM